MKRNDFIFATIFAMILMYGFLLGQQQDTTLIIDSNGNVGIGTTNPGEKLDIIAGNGTGLRVGTSEATNLHILHFATALADIPGSTFGMQMIGPLSSHVVVDVQANDGNDGFYVRIPTTPGPPPVVVDKTLLAVKANGNVGIGTSQPQEKFHIAVTQGSGYGLVQGPSNAYWVSDAQNNGCGLLMRENGQDKAFAYWSIQNQFFSIEESNQDRLVIKNGNVGIGTTSPSQKLHVIGNICATGSIGQCSDLRYKKDITPLSGSLNRVMQLQGVHYHWKAEQYPEKDFPGDQQIGFIAQEIEVLYPEVVLTDRDGYKSVDYARLTPVLVEAIKEQQQTIERQQAELGQLKTKMAQFEYAFQRLEAAMAPAQVKTAALKK